LREAERVYKLYTSKFRKRFDWIRSDIFNQTLTNHLQQDAQALMGGIRHEAHHQLSEAKRDTPALFSEIRVEASNVVKTSRALASTRIETIRDRAFIDVVRSRDAVRQEFDVVSASAHRVIADAKQSSEALFFEVAGQGPEKTLSRGFAIVRDEQGKPMTSAVGAKLGGEMEIEFRDGRLAAQVK